MNKKKKKKLYLPGATFPTNEHWFSLLLSLATVSHTTNVNQYHESDITSGSFLLQERS